MTLNSLDQLARVADHTVDRRAHDGLPLCDGLRTELTIDGELLLNHWSRRDTRSEIVQMPVRVSNRVGRVGEVRSDVDVTLVLVAARVGMGREVVSTMPDPTVVDEVANPPHLTSAEIGQPELD